MTDTQEQTQIEGASADAAQQSDTNATPPEQAQADQPDSGTKAKGKGARGKAAKPEPGLAADAAPDQAEPQPPTPPAPSIGSCVQYRVTPQDVETIAPLVEMGKCSVYEVGDIAPALVTRVWGASCVNLRVFFDGAGDITVTSSTLGTSPRCWQPLPAGGTL